MELVDGSTSSIKFFAVESSFSSLSEDFNVDSRNLVTSIIIERLEIEFSIFLVSLRVAQVGEAWVLSIHLRCC